MERSSGWWFGTWLLCFMIYGIIDLYIHTIIVVIAMCTFIGIILPIDFHIFQRGRSTTNQSYNYH